MWALIPTLKKHLIVLALQKIAKCNQGDQLALNFVHNMGLFKTIFNSVWEMQTNFVYSPSFTFVYLGFFTPRLNLVSVDFQNKGVLGHLDLGICP